MRRKVLFFGGLLAIIIISGIGGYFLYQSLSKEPKEPTPTEPPLKLIDTIDLSHENWFRHDFYPHDRAKFVELEGNVFYLKDDYAYMGVYTHLIFPDIIIGKVQLKILTDNDNRDYVVFEFFNHKDLLFFIWRDHKGKYFFSVNDISITIFDSHTTIYHTWNIEWDFSGIDKLLTLIIDGDIHLENYKVNTNSNSVNKIVWRTSYKTIQSGTYLKIDESYIKSYQKE